MKKIFALLIISIVSLAACQRTPEDGIVQSKNNDDIYLTTQQDGNESSETIPGHWEHTITNGRENLEIIINADIVTGGIKEYPVLSIENKEFTNEFAHSIMKSLFGDKPLWKHDTIGTSTVTKDSINAMLNLYTEMLKDRGLSDEKKEDIKEDMQWLMALYPDALDSRYQIPALTEFSDVTTANHLYCIDYEYTYSKTIYGEEKTYEQYQAVREKLIETINEGDALNIEGIVDLGDGKEAYINIRKNDSYGNPASIYYYVRSLEEINMETIGEVYRAPELTIEEDEACEIAEDILKNLGIYYMALVDKSKGSSYEFSFAREINGTTPNVVYNYAGNKEAYTYRAQVGQEAIIIHVNNDGLMIFEWLYPSETVELIADDVDMMAFDDTMDIFARQIIVNNSYSGDDEYIEKRTIYIDEIKLGSMTVAQSNNSSNVIIPVWDFYGHEIIKYKDDYLELEDHYDVDENNERTIQEEEYSYLTVNAVNGTIVNRYYGY